LDVWLREDRPQGADTRRERVTVALNDIVKLLGESDRFFVYWVKLRQEPVREPLPPSKEYAPPRAAAARRWRRR